MPRTSDRDALLHQVPPRVLPSSLRAVALRGERQWRVSLGLCTAICAVTVAVFFPWPIADDIRVDLGGMAGRGVVVDSVYANRSLGDDIVWRKRHVFRIRFRFDDSLGREIEATCLFFRYLEPETQVDVEYLASSPKVARVKDGFFVPAGWWEVWWSAGFIVLPLAGVWNFRRWRRRRLSLLIHGICVPGHVERAWRDDLQDDALGWIEVCYAAQSGPIRLSERVESEVYRRACAIVEDRRPVHVLHDPNVPRHHIVVELMR